MADRRRITVSAVGDFGHGSISGPQDRRPFRY